MINLCYYVLFISIGTTVVSGRPNAVNTLSYYEPLNYDPSNLASQHARAIRDVGGVGGKGPSVHGNRGSVQLHIDAFNRSFVSSLSHSKKVFAENVKFLVNGVSTDEYDPKTFYSGELEGEVGYHVTGHVIDGVFDGVIQSQQGTFHVERSHKFFPTSQEFHSIIYHEDNVLTPDHASSCGAKGKLLEELNNRASHAVPLTDDKTTLYGKDRYSRLKRQTINNNKFCQIRVTADHLYLANIGGGSIINTMSDIASLISSVQEIFREADFDDDGIPDGIQPVIVSLEVLKQNTPGYRYGADNIAVNDFLDFWSQENQEDFCLSLLLTYRDFANGVLGLAWVAQSSGGNSGGICERQVRLGSGLRSLNTAIVTFVNYGRTQPRSVSTVTVAHEFGHNFGSPHDPSGTCSPGGSGGNFIMFPQATDGAQDNNKRFSSCSINSINAVLQTESGCFRQSAAFCGNGVLEGDEECDCGSMCSQDNCCNTNCTLTSGSQCSSVESCCQESCQFKSNDTVCLELSECGERSLCIGSSGTCPNPVPKRGNVLCNGGRNVCVDGVCAGSVCIRMNYTDCQCTIVGGDATKLCHACCNNGGTCQSSFDIFGSTLGQFREGGRSCDNFRGYCSNSIPPTCQIVDNERTLNDLLDIFNLNTLNVIVAWLQVYWYIPVGIIVGIAIIIILLQVTYRRRKPLKRRLGQIRRSTMRRRRGQRPPTNITAAQTGGVGSGGGGGGRGQERPRNREISQVEGERRLKRFFPTVDRDTMVSVMRVTRSESKAVRRLLDLGFPLQKVPLPRS